MALLLLACVGPSADDSAPATAYGCDVGPAVQVGTGDTHFVDLEDGAPVVMTHGQQGGWHIFYSFVAWNFGEIIQYDYTVEDVAGGRTVDAIDAAATVAINPGDAPCSRVSIGLLGYLSGDDPDTEVDETPPVALAGHELRVCLELIDHVDQFEASECVTVVASCDPVDQPFYPDTCS